MKTVNCSATNCTTMIVDESEIIGIAVIVGLFLVIGSVGNIITIIVIIKNKCLHIPSNYFIVSLSISDLISALICSPLWLYRRTWGFEHWMWTEGLCKFYWMLDFSTNYVTSMHILSFALLRCYAVYFPFRMAAVTKRRVLVYIIILWVVALLVSTPLISLMGVVEGRHCQVKGSEWPSCSIYNENNATEDRKELCCINAYNIYMLVTSTVFFYIPDVLIIALSIAIARALTVRLRWRNKATNINSVVGIKSIRHTQPENNIPDVVPRPIQLDKSSRSRTIATCRGGVDHGERNVFTQLGLIVVAFMIGYLPVTIYLVWTTASETADVEFDYWFGVVSYLGLRLSECMNPVMYNLGSSNIRRATKKLLGLSE